MLQSFLACGLEAHMMGLAFIGTRTDSPRTVDL